MSSHSRARSTRQNPSTCRINIINKMMSKKKNNNKRSVRWITSGFSCPQEAFTQDAFQSRMKFKIGFAAVNRNDEFGNFQSPFACQKLENVVGSRIESQSDELGLVGMWATQEIDGPKGVRRTADGVVSRRPNFARFADALDAVSFVIGPPLAASTLIGLPGTGGWFFGTGYEPAAISFTK